MKPFLRAFFPLALLLFGAGFWGAVNSFPFLDEVPASVLRQQELAGEVLEFVLLPVSWSRHSLSWQGIFFGSVLWASALSLVFAWLWRRFYPRRKELVEA